MSASHAIEHQEQAVGIAAYVSPNVSGFRCTIKHRYTDFLVNEILPDGHVLHLTNLNAQTLPKRHKQQSDRVENGTGHKQSGLPASINSGSIEEGDSQPKRPLKTDRHTDESNGNPNKRARIEQADPSTADDASGLVIKPEQNEDAIHSLSSKDRKNEITSGFSENDKATLTDIFGDKTSGQILNLYASVMIHPDRKPRDQPSVQSEPIEEKSKRTEAHLAVRRIFSSRLETITMQDLPGVIAIRAAPPTAPSGARGQPNSSDANAGSQKGRLAWDDLGGEYLHFSLYKENKDTMEVLLFIASQLKIQVKSLQFAGTKGRRGVTVQRVAVFRVHADRVARLNKSARGWRAGNFEYKKHGLDLGELGGNEFMLTLRDCHFDNEEDLTDEQRQRLATEVVAEATKAFGQRGFLNYYGLQRFGTFSTGTHMTGLKILKGDLEGAVDLILAYPEHLLPENQDASNGAKVPQDDIDRADAIRIWRSTRQANAASSKMPKRFQAEAAIIQYLGKKDRKTGQLLQDRDWQGALMQIQRNLRLMYVHAYQSFVWNTVAGKRWELHGSTVVEGDLVIIGEKDDAANDVKPVVDQDGEPIFHPTGDDSAPLDDDPYTRARQLSKAEAESGKYDIFDIVLALPGFDVEYPANAIGKFYDEFMASEVGGQIDPHNMRRSWKDVSLPGSYRKLMARPGKDLSFEVKSYVSDDEQMVETDLDKLETRKAQPTSMDAGEAATKEERASKIAVVLKLQLGSSQYATMALRELSKAGAVNYRPEYSTR